MSHDERPEHGWGLPAPEPATTILPEAPPAPPSPRRRRTGRTVVIALLTLTLLAVAAGAGVAAWRNYDAGAAWQQRAGAEAERAEAAEAALTLERERAAGLDELRRFQLLAEADPFGLLNEQGIGAGVDREAVDLFAEDDAARARSRKVVRRTTLAPSFGPLLHYISLRGSHALLLIRPYRRFPVCCPGYISMRPL